MKRTVFLLVILLGLLFSSNVYCKTVFQDEDPQAEGTTMDTKPDMHVDLNSNTIEIVPDFTAHREHNITKIYLEVVKPYELASRFDNKMQSHIAIKEYRLYIYGMRLTFDSGRISNNLINMVKSLLAFIK